MRFLIKDHTGHSVIKFSKDEVAEAMEKFRMLVEEEKKTPAVKGKGQGEYTVSRTFDPNAEDVLFVPHMVGG